MSDANFASLSSTLLARKGGAKPAMRPQSGIVGPVDGKEAAANLEDLGWNDMGDEDQAEAKPAADNLFAMTPAAANEVEAPNEVRESLSRIQAQLDKPAESASAQLTPADAKAIQRKPAVAQGKRAAFTLRLDQERHLMLRLACTVRGRSAQQLVTDALDGLLAEMPEIASLAAQVQQGTK